VNKDALSKSYTDEQGPVPYGDAGADTKIDEKRKRLLRDNAAYHSSRGGGGNGSKRKVD
jgi:hypothetical protein